MSDMASAPLPKAERGPLPLVAEPIAFHPGELLAEELEARGLTQKAFAAAIGRPPSAVSAIVHGRARLTPETALAIEQALGISAQLWVDLQGAYDLSEARRSRKAG